MAKNRASEFLNEIMNLMEKKGLEQWEAEWVAKRLPEEIKENSRRKKAHQPFTVFKKKIVKGIIWFSETGKTKLVVGG